jgi:hypothetical protein
MVPATVHGTPRRACRASTPGYNRQAVDVLVQGLCKTLEACGVFLHGSAVCLQDDGLPWWRADHCREPAQGGRVSMGPAHVTDGLPEHKGFTTDLGVLQVAEGICTGPGASTHGCSVALGHRDRRALP